MNAEKIRKALFDEAAKLEAEGRSAIAKTLDTFARSASDMDLVRFRSILLDQP